MTRLNSEIASLLMKETLLELGLNETSTNHLVASMTQTSLRGVDSHGINLFPHYFRAIEAGRISKNPQIVIHQRTPATAQLDADNAVGHLAGAEAMNQCIKIAKQQGIGAVSVRNSSHFGAASYFGFLAADQGLIGLSFTNADSLVKAFGAEKAVFGTNPICFTAPMKGEEPFCLDMATSTIAWNKIANYQNSGLMLEPNWAYDHLGNPTLDPKEAKSLSSIGGYKGFGLGMMVDILCSFLSGGPSSPELKSMYGTPLSEPRHLSHFFIAISIEAFLEVDEFSERLSKLATYIRGLDQSGNKKSKIPGDPEKETFQDRIKFGIPMDSVKFEEFININPNFKKAVLVG